MAAGYTETKLQKRLEHNQNKNSKIKKIQNIDNLIANFDFIPNGLKIKKIFLLIKQLFQLKEPFY